MGGCIAIGCCTYASDVRRRQRYGLSYGLNSGDRYLSPEFDLSKLCVICCSELPSDSKKVVSCGAKSNPHRYCLGCLESLICITWVQRDHGIGVVPTQVDCCAIGCSTGGFTTQVIAARCSPATFSTFLAKVQKCQHGIFVAELRDEFEKRERKKRGSGEHLLLEKQMALQLNAEQARECPRCGFVVLSEACSNLETHHDSEVIGMNGRVSKISNKCGRCNFFAASKDAWKPFRGRILTVEESDAQIARWFEDQKQGGGRSATNQETQQEQQQQRRFDLGNPMPDSDDGDDDVFDFSEARQKFRISSDDDSPAVSPTRRAASAPRRPASSFEVAALDVLQKQQRLNSHLSNLPSAAAAGGTPPRVVRAAPVVRSGYHSGGKPGAVTLSDDFSEAWI